MKRDVPGWDEYFMKIAELVKTRSKDRSTQVGAVIVREHRIISTGYNSFPAGLNDDVNSRHERPAKYMWTEHAERNAIYSAARHGIRLIGSSMYVTGGGIACAECARAISLAGISEAIGMEGKFEGAGPWAESCKVGEELLREADVKLVFLNDKYERS
ncbi:cytidine/deoxycytidylate deaminase family protein [Verrucomicrobiota bacterium]